MKRNQAMNIEDKIIALVDIYGVDDRFPSEAQWRQVASVPSNVPLIISNLFEVEKGKVSAPEHGFDGSGVDAWTRYVDLSAPTVEKYGLEVLSSAELEFPIIGPENNHWDVAVMVRYPSSAAFLDLHLDTSYCENALPFRRLFVKRQWMFLTQALD